MNVRASIVGLWVFCCLPALAQDVADAILLTNVGIWDGSSGEIRKNRHILIVAGEIIRRY
jgi:hypothetical protein